jgi:formate dehydrogenase major subunit
MRSYVGRMPNPVSWRTHESHARIHGADVGVSVCPYCAVGCSQLVYSKNGRVIDIEGNYESPINGGTLCPKGAATSGFMNSPYLVS